MKISKLLENTDMICSEDEGDIEISGVCYDSRRVTSGDIFVCISGFKSDGHAYAKPAVEAGAAAVIAEHPLEDLGVPVIITSDARKTLSAVSANFFERPSDDMLVFGVTGTNGKTTTSYLLKSIVEKTEHQCAVLGTIAYVYGGQTFGSSNTTPESYELQRMFKEMKDDYDTKVCAMEVSSHSLALSRVSDIAFDYSLFTNLTPDHMDFHKDFENYYAAKKKLFEITSKCSIINIDDDYGKRLAKELREEGRSVKTCAVDDADADYRAIIIEKSVAGSIVEFITPDGSLGELRINTPGRFSVENAIGAAAVTLEAGIEWKIIKAGIEEVKGVAGRFESVENSKGMAVIVDYAHTPDALENVLKTAREFTENKLITVFGCGGDRDSTKRPIMGKVAGELSDYCVVTSDNPRTEDPFKILDDIVPGIEPTGCEFTVIEDRRRAIKQALKRYEKGDVIIIAGKGHEDYQIIGTVKQYFDDRETALQIIEQEI